MENSKANRVRKRKIAEALFSKAIKIRDGYACRKCKMKGVELEAAHFISRGVRRTQFEFSNCFTLCRNCHRWAHAEREDFKSWVMSELGNNEFNSLAERSTALRKETVEEYNRIIEVLKVFIKRCG